ncbi:MAG: dienelactone hydrolase family protein [Phototrophicaceae bacterium]
MTLYQSDHVEYNTESGNIRISLENGEMLPAYWAHPATGTKFPGVLLIHNWWGITEVIRLMANRFAQTGYYVIVPDLFNGAKPQTHREALTVMKALGDASFERLDAALTVLEEHHRCNAEVAAVGVGMGGSLAYEAAIKRTDLEVAVSFYGFPQKYLGQLATANTPILAVYGDQDPFVPPAVVEKLKSELASSPLASKHLVKTIAGVGHGFFADKPNSTERELSGVAWATAIDFIEDYITPPKKPVTKKKR